MTKGTFHKVLENRIYELFDLYEKHGTQVATANFTYKLLQDLKLLYDTNIENYKERIVEENHETIHNSSVIAEVNILEKRLELMEEMSKCLLDGNYIEI